MFIRIKRRKVSDAHKARRGQVQPKDKVTLDFVVVEATRTEKGPRQRVVKHIGSLLERLSTCPINLRWFYRVRVEPALRFASGGHPDAYQKLMDDMQRKLPRA